MNIKPSALGLITFALLAGCASSFIEVRPGSERIAVLEANQVTNCQSKGSTTVSVYAGQGALRRFDEDVESNLLQMARNSAVDAGGDVVVKGESSEPGKRTFGIYKCHP